MSVSLSVLRAGRSAVVASMAVAVTASPAFAVTPSASVTDPFTYPGSDRVVDEWKFVGRGSASAVQIAPRWVLTCDHSSIVNGATFRNGWGEAKVLYQVRPSTNYADKDGPIDLTLHLLDQPIVAPRYPKLLSHPTDVEFSKQSGGAYLGLGYPSWYTGERPTFGWVDGFGMGLPRAAFPVGSDQPVGEGGDSGGAVFYFPSATGEGALAATLCMPNSPLPGLQQPFAGFDARGASVRAFFDQTFASVPSAAPATWTSLAALAADGPRPSAPSGVRRSGTGATSAKIVWSAPASTPVARAGYTVFVDGVARVSVGATATSATVSGLSRSTAYDVWVAARSSSGALSYPSPTVSDRTWFKTGWLF